MQFYETNEQLIKKKLLELIVLLTHKKQCFKIANGQEELEKICAFRYKIYYENLGRDVEGIDHRHKIIRDELDDCVNTLNLYMGDINNPELIMRTILWEKNQMPAHTCEEYDIHKFEWINSIKIVEFGRLMANPQIKRPMNMVLFLGALVHYLAMQHQVGLILASCKPGLVMRYLLLGLNPYTKKLIKYPDGIEVPMAAFIDTNYGIASHSPLSPCVTEKYIVEKNCLDDFYCPNTSVIYDHPRIHKKLKQKFCVHKKSAPSEKLLSLLVKYGSYIIDISANTKIAHQGSAKNELYYLLSGEAYTLEGEAQNKLKGFLIDEVFVLNQKQNYLKDIYIKKGKILVIRKSTMLRLKKEHSTDYLELLKLIHQHHNLNRPVFSKNVYSTYEL